MVRQETFVVAITFAVLSTSLQISCIDEQGHLYPFLPQQRLLSKIISFSELSFGYLFAIILLLGNFNLWTKAH